MMKYNHPINNAMFSGRIFSLLKKQLVKNLACKSSTGRGWTCTCVNKIKNIPPTQTGYHDIIDLCQDYGFSGHGPWCPNDSPGSTQSLMRSLEHRPGYL